MRAWILAAVAALSFGQAEARTVTFASQPLLLQKQCLTEYEEFDCKGASGGAPQVVAFDWTFEFDEALLSFIGGVAHVSYDTQFIASWTSTVFAKTVSGWTVLDTPDPEELRSAEFDVSSDGAISNLIFSIEASTIAGQYWFDRDAGGTVLRSWTFNGEDDLTDFAEYAEVSPVPVPAAAPLLGGALMLLAGYRRRRSVR